MQLVFATGFLVPQRLLGQDYYRGVNSVYPDALFPEVAITGKIKDRAETLARVINERFPAGSIHLIAHSMGGLDARYALHNNLHGLANPGRVQVLSTIATPHHGTPIGDLIDEPPIGLLDLRSFAYKLATDALRQLGLPAGAIGELTTSSAAKFNSNVTDVPHIRYRCFAGSGVESFLLRPNHQYLELIGATPEEQANDGLVTVSSASWTPLAEPPWNTDHIGKVGHNLDAPPAFASAFNHLGAIQRIVQDGLNP